MCQLRLASEENGTMKTTNQQVTDYFQLSAFLSQNLSEYLRAKRAVVKRCILFLLTLVYHKIKVNGRHFLLLCFCLFLFV